MNRFYFFVALAFLCAVGQTEDSKPLYRVGETWIYDVKGMEIGVMGKKQVDEKEIIKIAGLREIDGAKKWVINIKSGDSFQKEYLDEKGYLHHLDLEGRIKALRLDVTPPIPDYIAYKLEIGEKKECKTDMIPNKNSLSNIGMTEEYTIERLEDETITVPAGTYENCIHYKERGTLKANNSLLQIDCSYTSDIWVHPSVNHEVKEYITYDMTVPGSKKLEKSERTKVLRRYSPGRNR